MGTGDDNSDDAICVLEQKSLRVVTDSTATESEDYQCHALPCNIDFDGRAPVKVYFMPAVVDDSKNENRIHAAHFRGRQLLASEPYQHHSEEDPSNGVPMQGRLLEIDAGKNHSSEGKVRVVDRFGSIYEWKHEHEPTALRNQSQKSRVWAAFQWCDVAHAMHDPIPIAETAV